MPEIAKQMFERQWQETLTRRKSCKHDFIRYYRNHNLYHRYSHPNWGTYTHYKTCTKCGLRIDLDEQGNQL